jgi:protein-disulfide isomerase
VEAFYLGRKDKFRKPFPEVRQQAARMLKSLRVTEARAAYTAKLRQQSSVEILLAPMRFPVEAGDAPRRGPATAPVTIVEFSDFQCPYCKRAQATLREILARYGDQVSLVFKDLPLTRTHREAQRAAEAARCAGEQGKYWEYHDALYAAPRITTDSYQQIARSLGLEADLLRGCLDSRKFRARVQDDVKQAGNVGASSTPTFFINGILLKGAQPIEAFAKIIDEELAARRASR